MQNTTHIKGCINANIKGLYKDLSLVLVSVKNHQIAFILAKIGEKANLNHFQVRNKTLSIRGWFFSSSM